MKRRRNAILLFAISVAFLSSCANITSTVIEGDKTITFYYVNDTHGAFIRQNTSTNYNEAGMAYISSFIKKEVAKDPDNSIVLSGGDMFQGGYESNITYGNIMVDAMNEIGFDAMVLGNHELDWGEDTLIDIASKLDCPIISANTFYKESKERPEYVKPYIILERDELKIGIIGAAIEHMENSILASISNRFEFRYPNDYLSEFSYKLRKEEHCDLVVAALHDGGFDDVEHTFYYSELADIDQRTNQSYIDGFFLAHDHQQKNGKTRNNVPYIESGCNGRYIGKMVFNLEHDGRKFNITSSSSYNIGAYSNCRTEDKEISKLLTKYEAEISGGNKVIYNFKNSYSRDDFAKIICDAMMWYVNSHLEDFDNKRVYFASHNPGGVRSTVASGEMTLRQLYTVCPFDNDMCIQRCTQAHMDFMKNEHDSFVTSEAEEIVFYENSYTYAVTITYLAEKDYYKNDIQLDYKEYNFIARDALLEYLTNNINPSL